MANETATNGSEQQVAAEPRKGKLPCAPWTLGGEMLLDDDCQPITGDDNYDADREIAPEHRVGCALYGELYVRLSKDNANITGELDAGWYRDWMRRTAAYAPFGRNDIKNCLEQLLEQSRDWRKRGYEANHLHGKVVQILAGHSEDSLRLGEELDKMFVERAQACRARAQQWFELWRNLADLSVFAEDEQTINEWRERRRQWHKYTPVVGSI